MNERERRIGVNEAVFREANERIQELNQTFASLTDRLVLVCECGDGACAEQITMATAAYEELRSDATQFVIVPGHEVPDVEELIATYEEYAIVRKSHGTPRQIAEATDPR